MLKSRARSYFQKEGNSKKTTEKGSKGNEWVQVTSEERVGHGMVNWLKNVAGARVLFNDNLFFFVYIMTSTTGHT